MKKWFILAVVFFSLAACGGQQSNSQSSNSTPVVRQPVSTPSVPLVTPHHKIGERVTASNWNITLDSVHTQASEVGYGGMLVTPTKAGMVFLEVAVRATNISTTEQTMEGYQFVLRGDDGTPYGANYEKPDVLVVAKVESGGPLKGQLVYDVPPSVHHYILRFSPDLLPTTSTVIWDLKV